MDKCNVEGLVMKPLREWRGTAGLYKGVGFFYITPFGQISGLVVCYVNAVKFMDICKAFENTD